MLLSIGLCLFNPYPTLDQAAFVPMREWGDDTFWGSILTGVGLIRLVALWRNGGWVPSPWIRLMTAGVSACIWALFALGLQQAFVLLPIFLGFIVADIYSAGRASTDARLSRDERLRQPEAPKIVPIPVA
jgi:hypothetical protein